jgi:GNAT superfamily N-acetyltransferase
MMCHLVEVRSGRELDEFIRFPNKLYSKSRYHIPALHKAERSTLSSELNPAFGHCEARYWLAVSQGRTVGRIAGIINHRYNEEHSARYIRFGWLDFEENARVLKMLIDAAEMWGRERNMEFVHGPLGFTSFDPSGVLVDGFDEWPTAWGRYNHPYYDPMLRNEGFQKDVDWIEKTIQVPVEKSRRETRLASTVRERYSLRNAELRGRKDIMHYTGELFNLVNRVYKGLYGFSTLSDEQIGLLIENFIPLVQRDLTSVILNNNEEVVAFGLVLPSLSKAMKRANGRLTFFTRLYILKALKFNDTVDMLLIGVKPEYQNKGAHSLIFEKIITALHRRGIKKVETTRELETNQKVQQLWAGYDSRLHKRARCYVKKL